VTYLTTAQHERTQFIRCNTIGHAWFDVDSNHWTASFGTPLTVRCERCGAERRDKIGQDGEVLPGGRYYVYPEGYKYDKGMRPSRAEFRQMLIAQRIREARQARKLAMKGA